MILYGSTSPFLSAFENSFFDVLSDPILFFIHDHSENKYQFGIKWIL